MALIRAFSLFKIDRMTAEILEKIGSYNKNFNRDRVKQAFDFVAEKYPDTDGSVNYPMEVLEVLIPLKPDEDTIVAVLLHDLYAARTNAISLYMEIYLTDL